MIDIPTSSDIPIREFPLVWRWTQPSHALFDANELAALRAIDSTSSTKLRQLLCERGIVRSLQTNDCLQQRLLEARGLDDGAVETWLRRLPVPEDLRVWLSYRWSDALELPWSLFVRRWSDFCYPSFDDLVVVPSSAEWVFEYWHHETLVWYPRAPGSACSTDSPSP